MFPEKSFDPPRLVPDVLAGWARGATANLPDKYDTREPEVKAEHMITGHFVKRGPADMDYFFYSYRTDMIRRFCAEVFEHARAVRPKVELSARVHWNAPAAGRFAGQRWTDFGQWFDFLVLDVDRSHLPGDYDTYRKLLQDVAFYMTTISYNLVHVYAGIGVCDTYLETREIIEEMLDILADLTANPEKDAREPAAKLSAAFDRIKPGLTTADKTLAKELEDYITSIPMVSRMLPICLDMGRTPISLSLAGRAKIRLTKPASTAIA